MDRCLIDFATRLADSKDASARWGHVNDFYSDMGFDVVNCGIYDARRQKPIGIYTNMSDAWMEHYAANGYAEIDPWFERLKRSRQTLIYSRERAEEAFGKLTVPVKSHLDEIVDVGIRSSVCLIYENVGSEVTGFHLASRKGAREFDEQLKRHEDVITLSSAIAAAHLTPPGNVRSRKPGWYGDLYARSVLSDRECDVLSYLAGGHNNEGTADSLNIATTTVNFHLQNIKRKLSARTRAQAIGIAISEGIISP